METKSFDPCALAGLTTGTVLTNFSDMHEAAEFVMGCPIWTHQFPVMLPRIKAAILAQYPDLPTKTVAGPEGWKTTRDEVRARYGGTLEVRKGQEEGIDPLDPAGFPKN